MTILRFGLAMAGKNVNSPSLLSKRGGSGTAALTNTLDPSAYPTSPPQSAYKGGIPKIGGSEGGFIGLLVGLIILILVCCGIVYYLLRTRQHGGRLTKKNHPSSTTPATDSKGFFTSLRDTRRENAGWIQQGDEFDYDSDEDLKSRSLPKLGYGVGYRDGGSKGLASPHEQQKLQDTVHSSSAIDVYSDPFDPDSLPESVRKQQVPLPVSSSLASQDPPIYNSAGSHSILRESPTTPTFEGGSKFREQF